MRLNKIHLVILAIILLASLLRLASLGSIPVGFNDDEAAFGYNAYSIAKTARDEWGRFLPFPVFESFGDWKLVPYLYLTLLSQSVFGLNEFATRFPSALFGIASVLATYFLTRELFEKKTALIASFFLAISPWHIIASRNAFESDLLIFFITTATYFFVKSLKEKKYFPISMVFFTTCFYVYRSSWLFIPVFILGLIYLHRQFFTKNKNFVIKIFILTFMLLIPLIPTVLTFKGQSRFFQESFITGTSQVGIVNQTNEKRGVCNRHLSVSLCVLLYNRYSTFASTYVFNYLSYIWPPTYLAPANPTGFQSYATRGALFFFELPLLILGFIYIFKSKNTKARVLLLWVLAVPIAASIAGGINFGRINILMPAPQIIAAFGLSNLVSILISKYLKSFFVLVFLLVVVFSLSKLIFDIFFIEPYNNSRYQRYGYKDLFSYLREQETNYDHIWISASIDGSHQYIQYLYFEKIDPAYTIRNQIRNRREDGWTEFSGIGKYEFVPKISEIEKIPPKTLVVVGEHELRFEGDSLKEIRDLRGDVIFKIYDSDNLKKSTNE